MRRLLLATFAVASSAWSAPTRLNVVSSSVFRTTRVFLLEGEDERQARLKQLFGDQDAAKIAEQTGLSTAARREAPQKDIQMLVEGIQELEWGGVRLIDVAMTDGPLEASFEPCLPGSRLLSVRLDMPLGMLLEEDATTMPGAEGTSSMPLLVVAELLEDGSARKGGVQVGDLIRATTAVTMAMSYPTWNLIAGGIGRPKLQKILFSTQNEPFEKVMAALGSNAREQQGNGQVVLMLERPPVGADAS